MLEPAIECGDPHVADLLIFVAARAEEDRAHHTLVETCDVVQHVLLDLARETCRAEDPCPLPEPCLRALGEYAFSHASHPEFQPAWLRWRLLEGHVLGRPPGL